MMRLSKRISGLLMGGLLSTFCCSLSEANPIPQNEPNWYAPDGYFTSLVQELRGAMKTFRLDIRLLRFVRHYKQAMETLVVAGLVGTHSMAPIPHVTTV